MGARSLIGRINVGEKLILMHTKYILCGPRGVKEDTPTPLKVYGSYMLPWQQEFQSNQQKSNAGIPPT